MKFNILNLFALFFLFASCSNRNLSYLSDLEGQGEYVKDIEITSRAKIQPGDLLSITVSSMNPQASMLFNQGILVPPGTSASAGEADNPKQGFLVSEEGFINYPVLGKIQLGGLTKEEAVAKLTVELEEYLEEPIVNVRFLNYHITVIGEVNKPSSFTIPSERINILEALGMAGDMTAYGKRESVMVIREEEGQRKIQRLNLNTSEIFNSPYFYLQQNDVVYVEPVEAKAEQASLRRSNISIILSAASVLAVILTRLL